MRAGSTAAHSPLWVLGCVVGSEVGHCYKYKTWKELCTIVINLIPDCREGGEKERRRRRREGGEGEEILTLLARSTEIRELEVVCSLLLAACFVFFVSKKELMIKPRCATIKAE